MKNKRLLVLGVLSFLICAPLVVGAQGLVTCTGVNCNLCTLTEMVNNLIVWLIQFLTLVIALLLVVAGFKLVTSGGDVGAWESAKKMFTNVIIGFIIIMSAWLIVDTIMKYLVGGTVLGLGPWNELECGGLVVPKETDFKGVWPGSTEDALADAGGLIPDIATCSGSTCVRLSAACSNPASCSVSPAIVDRINKFHADVLASGISGTRVTEAVPPAYKHHSAVCHKEGTCIDYSRHKSNPLKPTEVAQMITLARKNGLRPVYEVHTDAQKNSLVRGGVNASDVKVLGDHITAPHFSIYGR